jgi:hypothetical protein
MWRAVSGYFGPETGKAVLAPQDTTGCSALSSRATNLCICCNHVVIRQLSKETHRTTTPPSYRALVQSAARNECVMRSYLNVRMFHVPRFGSQKVSIKFGIFIWATSRMIGGSSPGRGWEFSPLPPRPDPLWDPPSLLSNGYQGLLPWG